MNEKQKEQRYEALERCRGFCKICGKPLSTGAGQYAHKIANKKMWREKYGSFFIDNTLNGEYVCSLKCNAKVDVGSSIGKHLEILAEILIGEYIKLYGSKGLAMLTDRLIDHYKEMGVSYGGNNSEDK